ncbi:MAG: hypothetical protein ACRDNL_12250 [Spirillospora sp.]
MPVEGPEVVPSTVDDAYECVRADLDDTARPPGPQPPEATRPGLCPEGYVPRLKRRDYELHGKRVETGTPPERNPRSREDR